jgi:hypothetical protein
MQLDMHFYGIYTLARAAGIKDKTAQTIAYASQFVDDAIDEEAVLLSNKKAAILPTMTSHKPLDYKNAIPSDQWNVWVPFHFLPGNRPKAGDFLQRMTCRRNSIPIDKMKEEALKIKNKKYWPHLIGITAHVYADSFSHFGFLGFAHSRNKVINDSIKTSKKHSSGILRYIRAKFEDFKTRFVSDFAEIVPVGHGSVGTYPDRPYLKWSFKYESSRHPKSDTDRDNVSSFLQACKEIHNFFIKFAQASPKDCDPNGANPWKSISKHVHKILKKEAPKNDRIKLWKQHLESGNFCHVTSNDRKIEYEAGLWRPRRAEYESGQSGIVKNSHACRFIRAAVRHREFVLHELLPEIGLIIH